MDILRCVPEADVAIGAAAQQHREFGSKAYQAFINQRLAGQLERFGVAGRGDAPLALAVIAITAGLEDAGGADTGQSDGKVFPGNHRRIGRGPAAELLDKALLGEAVLCSLQCARMR